MAVGLLLLFVVGGVAFFSGAVTGLQDDVDADIDEGIALVLSRDVPSGIVDEMAGSYRGVSLGDPKARVTRALGRPARQGRWEVAVPDVLTGSVYAGEGSWTCGGKQSNVLAYREAVFTIEDGAGLHDFGRRKWVVDNRRREGRGSNRCSQGAVGRGKLL